MVDDSPLTPDQAADFLQISKSKLYQLLKSESPPPSFMIGEQPRFLKAELLEWLRLSPR